MSYIQAGIIEFLLVEVETFDAEDIEEIKRYAAAYIINYSRLVIL